MKNQSNQEKLRRKQLVTHSVVHLFMSLDFKILHMGDMNSLDQCR